MREFAGMCHLERGNMSAGPHESGHSGCANGRARHRLVLVHF